MKSSRAGIRAVVLFGAALCFRTALNADETAPAASEPAVSPEDEIIVTEKALERLRVRVERAEDDVYARFNEINSNDAYDIHCYRRLPTGSRIEKRVCLSNAARAAEIAIAQATVGALQTGGGGGTAGPAAAPGGGTAIAQAERAKQFDTERRVHDEMRRLAHDDPVLGAAVARLGIEYQALNDLTGSRPGEALSVEQAGSGKELPFDAQHLFDVRVGNAAWSHALTSRTFTLANVQGRIRDLHVDCDRAAATLPYSADAEWTIPDSWGMCTLQVSAKRGTTFALYEFERPRP